MTHNCPAGLVAVPYENLTICVTPDYYMVDGIRVPLTLAEAFNIADAQEMILPTTAMVDAIWRRADIQLPPRPLNPSNTGDPNFYNNLVDPKYNRMHNDIIEQQLAEHNISPSALIAGHKKDIVLHDRSSSRIAMYGWHQSNGRPIQTRSIVHGRDYKDYSQGLRLISETAYDQDGNAVRLSF